MDFARAKRIFDFNFNENFDISAAEFDISLAEFDISVANFVRLATDFNFNISTLQYQLTDFADFDTQPDGFTPENRGCGRRHTTPGPRRPVEFPAGAAPPTASLTPSGAARLGAGSRSAPPAPSLHAPGRPRHDPEGQRSSAGPRKFPPPKRIRPAPVVGGQTAT